MAVLPSLEPAVVHAGDTLQWSRTLADYPASAGWVLSYVLINASRRYTFEAQADGDAHRVTVAASASAGWAAGRYDWRARVARAGEVFTVGEGRLEVRPSLSAATHDGRSTARRALEAVEAYLADPARLDAASYEIAGRKLSRYSLTELWAHRDRLRFEVGREEDAQRLAAGLPARGRVLVRFGGGV
jgi:hypothetical protein